MRITQAGFPNVVALLETTLSQSYMKWLASTKSILLVLDADPAGHRAGCSFLTTLAVSTKVLQHLL